ncbi:MAG: AraC family transcriptional regulator [Hyphomonadaceae bacterium]
MADLDAAAQATMRRLTFEPAPPDLAPLLFGFVHRDDPQCGAVVRVLPEPRSSIQIMVEDPYWLRDTDDDAPWRRLPRIALWGPRHQWCYGYAARHIRAYAVGLSAIGLRALAATPAPHLLNQVAALEVVQPALAHALTPNNGESFPSWRDRATAVLRTFFATRAITHDPLGPAIDILATAEGGAVADAADAAGLSERQFRRVFLDLYGVTPKRYQRALRVDRMIRRLHAAPWEDDAFAAPIPFADQPHAIREFQAMTGLTPRAYLHAKRRGDATLRSVDGESIAPPQHAGA